MSLLASWVLSTPGERNARVRPGGLSDEDTHSCAVRPHTAFTTPLIQIDDVSQPAGVQVSRLPVNKVPHPVDGRRAIKSQHLSVTTGQPVSNTPYATPQKSIRISCAVEFKWSSSPCATSRLNSVPKSKNASLSRSTQSSCSHGRRTVDMGPCPSRTPVGTSAVPIFLVTLTGREGGRRLSSGMERYS
ncbi:hypothetical protein B0H34DRAFT_547320 [Crassisporium funariophilum]|nr:hypothetical protein B0H34DRAFT_547320 [Crassisporium funariophilum]